MVRRRRRLTNGCLDGTFAEGTEVQAGFRDALAQQRSVLGALILRDMRTRFGRTALGFAIAVAWPLTHLLVMVGVAEAVSRVVPLGTNSTVFFATGIMPYILCLYPGRMMMLSIEQNKPMLLFPVVKVIDIVLARAFLEMTTAVCVLILFCGSLFVIGIDFIPREPEIAVAAVALTILYGVAFGLLSCILIVLFPMWIAAFFALMILQWLTSGAMQLPSLLPTWALDYIVYNPLFHCIGWLRSAYYDGYADGYLDPLYVVQISMIMLLVGLAGERAARGKLLMQ